MVFGFEGSPLISRSLNGMLRLIHTQVNPHPEEAASLVLATDALVTPTDRVGVLGCFQGCSRQSRCQEDGQ